MASLETLQMRNALSRGEVRQVGTDTPIAIRLKYIGTGTVTSVTTTTATDITMVTSDGGTDAYAFATYTTIGTLVDAINKDGIFSAKVLDSVRSETTASQFINGAITAGSEDGISYYDVLVDTDAADYFAVRLTYDRGFDKSHKSKHRVDLQEIVYLIDLGTAAANAVKIYKIDSDAVTETLVYQALSVDNTETTIRFANGEGVLSSDEGGDLVVKIDDSGNLANASGNLLRITGKIV